MAKKAKLTVKIDGDKSGLDRTLRSAGSAIKGFGTLATVALTAVAAAAAAAGAILAAGVKHALDLGGELSDMSDKTGIAIDQLMALQQAGKDAGLEDVTGAVNKMQVALVEATRNGTSPAAKALRQLGLSGAKLIQKSPVQQLQEIGSALNEIDNPARRTDILKKIFGKSGADMAPLLKNPKALEEAQAAIGKQAGMMKENARKFDEISDRMNRAKLKPQGFFVGVAKGMIDQLDEATKRFDKLDFADQGEKFGRAMAPILDKMLKIDWAKTFAQLPGKLSKAFDLGLNVLGGGKGIFADAGHAIKDAFAPFLQLPGMIARIAIANKAILGVMSTMSAAFKAFAAGFADLFVARADPEMMDAVKVKGFKARGTSLSTGGLTSGGLSSGSLATYSADKNPAYDKSIRTRRGAQNAAVMRGDMDPDQRSSMPGAFGVIRRGDKKRAEIAAREKAKQEGKPEGIFNKMDAKLQGIFENTAATKDRLAPTPTE